MTPPSSPSRVIAKRPVVAKRSGSVAVLTRQRFPRNLYKKEEKAATHDAMMKRFNLRKMSSSISIPTKFGRANEIVIDKAIGSKLQRGRRYSLHRSIRSMTSPKARQQAWRTLISPITPSSWTSTVHVIIMYAVYHFQSLYLPVFAGYYPDGSMTTSRIAVFLEMIYLLDLLLNFNTAYVEQGVLVTSRNRIAHNYIHKWFAFDLLSAIPVQLIYSILTDSVKNTNDQVRYVQIVLMILRLLRAAFIEKGLLLSRIVRVASQLTDWARYSRYSHLLGIAQLMWLVLIAVLRRLRSKMQDDNENQSNPTKRESAVVGQVKSPRIENTPSKPDNTHYQDADRYPINRSGQSKATQL